MIIGAMNDPKNNLVEEIGVFGEMGFDFIEVTIEAPPVSCSVLRRANTSERPPVSQLSAFVLRLSAQLRPRSSGDRAAAFYAAGRRFESCRGRH